ncbi:MAG TPA: hypothetical protein VFN61_16015 [Acidimicrobiales bacterium]|nr:hypothetical protein [Acidimicrobiales bacterium]
MATQQGDPDCSCSLSLRPEQSDFGIDRLGLTFPLPAGSGYLPPARHRFVENGQGREWSRHAEAVYEVGEMQIRERWTSLPSGDRVTFDFNPSRLLEGPSWGLCPIELALAVAREVWTSARQRRVPLPPLGDATVSRVDVASNVYGVEDVARSLRGLSGHHSLVRYGKWRLYGHGKAPRSLYFGGATSGYALAYDKAFEVERDGARWSGKGEVGDVRSKSETTPPGLMRFEVQARNWLKRAPHPIRTVTDLTPERLTALFEARAAWARWEVPMVGSKDIHDVIDAWCEEIAPHRRPPTYEQRWKLAKALCHMPDDCEGALSKEMLGLAKALPVGVSPGEVTGSRRINLAEHREEVGDGIVFLADERSRRSKRAS